MNSPIHSSVEHAFVLLLGLRQYCGDHSLARYMSVDGFIQGLYWADVITNDQYQSLTRLALECFCNSGRPFPSPVNLGPVMPAKVAYERSRQPVALVGKPQALVAAHESDKQVPAPTAPRRLPMQRVLVSPFHVLRTLFGEPVSRSIRPAFSRLHPSWAPVSAGWPVALSGSQMRLPLGATQTPSPILERDLQRQKRALRADLRAIRLRGAC